MTQDTESGKLLAGLPNLLREAMVANYNTCLAMALDALLYLGYALDTTPYTFKELYAGLESLGWSDYFARRALAPLRTTSLVRYTGGRPSFVYRTLPLSFWLDTYKINPAVSSADISDVLNVADLATPKKYRMALHREYIARMALDKGHCSFPRQFLSQRLGLSRNATRHYDKLLGTIVTPNIECERILESPQDVYNQFRDNPEGNHKFFMVVRENVLYSYAVPYIQAIANKALRKGQTVMVFRHYPNNYYLPCEHCVKDESYRGYRFKTRQEYRNPYSYRENFEDDGNQFGECEI